MNIFCIPENTIHAMKLFIIPLDERANPCKGVNVQSDRSSDDSSRIYPLEKKKKEEFCVAKSISTRTRAIRAEEGRLRGGWRCKRFSPRSESFFLEFVITRRGCC